MSLRKRFIELIHEVLKKEKFYSAQGEVKRIDKQRRLCEIQPVDGTPRLTNVRMQAIAGLEKGLFVVPKIGSLVIVSFLGSATGFISSTGELEEILVDSDIIVNGGKAEGVPNYPELKQELETEKQRLTALINAINNAAVTQKDGGATLKSSIYAAMQGVPIGNYSNPDIKDERFKH